MHMVSIFHWKGVLQLLAKVLMLWWLAKSLCAVCHALLSQCHKAKGHVHPSFSPAPRWPRGSPRFPELRVLSWWGQCGDRCWQCPSVRAGRAKSGHLWALRWSLPGHGDLGGPPPPERREYWASLEGGDHDHLILSVITFPLPLGVQPWGLVYPAFLQSMVKPRAGERTCLGTATQAAMGHFVALHTFSSVPPNALWSCKGQST